MEDSGEYDQLIRPLALNCRIFGCWPDRCQFDNKGSIRYILQIYHQYFAIVCTFIGTVGAAADVIHFWGEDMNETIESALVTLAFSMAFLRTIVFTSHQKDMLEVVEMMRRDWTKSSAEDRTILRNTCMFAFKLSKYFTILVVMTSLAFIFMPILEDQLSHEDHKRTMPYRGYYYFFNQTVSPVYEYTYIANCLVGVVGCSTISGATGFSLISTIHGAAKFSTVQKDFKATKFKRTANKAYGKCIERHSESIRFAETVEKCINFLALAQFLISTGLICVAGFQLTMMLEDRARFMKFSSFLNSAIMELFIFSYSGQKLKTESEDVADCVYSSDWFGSDHSTDIDLVILRARKPCTITAGKFYDMCLESFLKVLSSSFSYFTVLLAMKED